MKMRMSGGLSISLFYWQVLGRSSLVIRNKHLAPNLHVDCLRRMETRLTRRTWYINIGFR